MLQHIKVDLVAKGILGWVFFSTFLLAIFIQKDTSTFFQIGPNKDLHIFQIPIDNAFKYCIVVCYTMFSTVIRTIQQEVLMPWIIQSVQNEKEKDSYVKQNAYQIVIIDVVYRWFDWFMYMNILLSQIDMMIIEMIGNIGTSYYTTHYYLHSSIQNPELTNQGQVTSFE
jgi:hypothetical protein